MKIALAGLGFITGDIQYNKAIIEACLEEYAGRVDLIIFGESFLQGFDALTWQYEEDAAIAISQDSPIINEIALKAKKGHIGLSFGYFEKAEDKIFSSHMTISDEGQILDNFRRVSTGWKPTSAGSHYVEGHGFTKFTYKGLEISLGLCGDFWNEANCLQVKEQKADLVVWPIYRDIHYQKWNAEEKYAYAEQSMQLADKVLLVNSLCLDEVEDNENMAKAGVLYFNKGKIMDELPAGQEGILVIEI